MTVKDVAQSLFDSSSGILAVGITPWNNRSQKPTLSSLGGAFLCEPQPVRPWKDLLLDTFRMWHTADRYRPLDRLVVRVDNLAVEAECRGEWVVVTGTIIGHDIRKTMRRLLVQTFRELDQMEDDKVIPLFPVRESKEKPKQGKKGRTTPSSHET